MERYEVHEAPIRYSGLKYWSMSVTATVRRSVSHYLTLHLLFSLKQPESTLPLVGSFEIYYADVERVHSGCIADAVRLLCRCIPDSKGHLWSILGLLGRADRQVYPELIQLQDDDVVGVVILLMI